MLLHKTLTRQEVLETIAQVAAQNIPDDAQGEIAVDFNEFGEVEIYFLPSTDKNDLN